MKNLPTIVALIEAIENAAGDEPAARLQAATDVANDLTSLSDAVLNHFVEQARERGESWGQIGAVLGMTKQAAQQRFRIRWFDRLIGRRGTSWMPFTDRARRVVNEAYEEAVRLDHCYVGTEHLLLGIVREKSSIGSKALRDLGLNLPLVRKAVETKIGRGDIPVVARSLPCTPLAKQALYAARDEAKSLGHNYVGTEHLLLALSRSREGVAAQILRDSGITHQRLRGTLIGFLASHGS